MTSDEQQLDGNAAVAVINMGLSPVGAAVDVAAAEASVVGVPTGVLESGIATVGTASCIAAFATAAKATPATMIASASSTVRKGRRAS